MGQEAFYKISCLHTFKKKQHVASFRLWVFCAGIQSTAASEINASVVNDVNYQG